MPKQLTDVKTFMDIVLRPEVKAIKIKKNSRLVKFKAQTSNTLFTLVVADLAKAKKIETELKQFKVAVTTC